MSPTKTTTRAIAASIALVAAGATVAGAAVFQLPILGFGRAAAASASAPPVRATRARSEKVRPKVIVKTRYVDDIVHRPAPARVGTTRGYAPASPAYLPAPTPNTAVRPSATVTRSAPAVSVPAPHARSADDSLEAEHDDDPTVTTPPTVDARHAVGPEVDQ